MKNIGKYFFAHKKIIIIFISAIFIPSIILIYLSYNTFIQRRETVKNILESNLWISGNNALDVLENEMRKTEKKVLNRDNFIPLIEKDHLLFKDSFELLNLKSGMLFLLDSDFILIQPNIPGKEHIDTFQEIYNISSSFSKKYQRAETFEFSRKNYQKAIELYDQGIKLTPSKHLQAIAMEGKGRCLLKLKKYNQAEQTYNVLARDNSHYLNQAGHPFGIVAALQLYEIRISRNQKRMGLEELLLLYEKIRNGNWLLTTPLFDFFIVEIESILNENIVHGEFTEFKKSYENLHAQISPLKRSLNLVDFIRNEGISGIKKRTLGINNQNIEPERFLIVKDTTLHLISYTFMPGTRSNQSHYGGHYWDINYFKKEIIKKLFLDLEQDSGLHFQLVDDMGSNIVSSEKIVQTDIILDLSFRPTPLPWKLFVSHSDMINVETTAQREILIYGVLLIVIIGLMIFGAFLIVRDIYRESETTRIKTEFVHNISHELKTPLTLIRLYGETLKLKKKLSEKEKEESYEIITKESERLSHLIDNVLDFSRIEMGRKEFIFKKGNLANVISYTLESFQYYLDKKGFLVKTEISLDIPDSEFDEEAISSVLINLLSNSMKFSQRKKEITVKLSCDEENIVLEVSDKGIGMTQKEITKIFDRFYRAENKIVSKTRGSGLGLTLVKHIIDAHQGRIIVKSEPGKGSVFTVFLHFDSAKA
jgi:signal transduction histidine kinase/tetratricopeptide (TPR) repeat protein